MKHHSGHQHIVPVPRGVISILISLRFNQAKYNLSGLKWNLREIRMLITPRGTGTICWCPEWCFIALKIFKRSSGYAIFLHRSPMSSYPSFPLFNKFPSDVKRLIFEEAFEASNWNAVELAWVSHEVRAWWVLLSSLVAYLWINLSRIEPLVYQGVAVFPNPLSRTHRIRYRMLMDRIEGQQGPENHYAKYVQRLLVRGVDMVRQLVPLCPNLKSLALIGRYTDENIAILNAFFVPNGFTFSNLRRLSIRWRVLPSRYRSCHHPIFQGLTHLETDTGAKSCWNGLSTLKNLTNLRLNLRNTTLQGPDDLLRVLETIADVICRRFPTSLKYMTVHFLADHASYISTHARARFCCDVDTGKFDRRLLFDWSCFRPIHPLDFNTIPRDWQDFIDSWIYLPRCYQDFWTREELEIDNRNRMYGV